MRCAVCAAAKAQNFSSRATVATNHLVRLKSGALSPPDNTAIPCDAAKLLAVTRQSFAASHGIAVLSGGLSAPDNTAIPCDAAKLWRVTASSCAKSRRLKEFNL